MKVIKTSEELSSLREKLKGKRDPNRRRIILCGGPGCGSIAGDSLIDAFKEIVTGKDVKVEVTRTGCHGFCERGPLVVIEPDGIMYEKVNEDDAQEIVEETIIGNKVVERLLYTDPRTDKKVEKEKEVPFYKRQTRHLLDPVRQIDPYSLEDYIALGGYSSLSKVLTEMEPEGVIDTVKKSQIRGRGGGGFPTGRKWESAMKAEGDQKYVICNADEGDPGAFMDRALLEGNPHSVLEGMIIGAYAVGASQGYIYVRAEYPMAIVIFGHALKTAREASLLGKNILGSGFDFDVLIYQGGGAFVCGESSALMRSIEGAVGEPRAKHIHATDKGLWDSPTVLNNVETWSNIPQIINNGAEWFSNLGTEKSKGTKIFSLVGKVNNTGLVEVPMGMTLREIIFDIGGGIAGGKKFKAVQTGGPSGGCLPEQFLDEPIDFDQLTKAGSMMGSGGMIIMDETTCMVDVAKFFTGFNLDESCGKCSSCREGTYQMLGLLDEICKGEGTPEKLELLKELCEYVKDTSLCGLGKTAPNPVLTTMKYFANEYDAHINRKECPAKVCKALIYYTIDPEKCTGCHMCARKCPTEAATGEKKQSHEIDMDKCIKCGACFEACKFDAVVIGTGGR